MKKNDNIINLVFPNTLSRLAGNEFGEDTFNNQVKESINLKCMNIIVIPDNIQNVAISFVQGFTKEIFELITKEDFYQYFTIVGNDKVVNKFKKSIFY